MSYEINIGDILACSGESEPSERIKWYNRVCGVRGLAAEISHVAMGAAAQQVWESTTLNKWCDKSGVQINPFDEWLENYNGRVWVRRLKVYGNDFNRESVLMRIERWQHKLIGTPYEHGIPGWWELALCIPRWNFWNKTGYVHCSQGDAEVYKYADLCDMEVNSSNMPPWTFWIGGPFDESLRGCELGGMERLK